MEFSHFRGPTADTGPHHLLQELDRLLLLAGWTRRGLNPSALALTRAAANPGNVLPTLGPYAYEHPSGGVFWFMASPTWFLNGANYESELQLVWGLQPVYAFTPPQETYLSTAQHVESASANNAASWIIGASVEGFYLVALGGSQPGGFSLEKTSDGRWLYITYEKQNLNGTHTPFAPVAVNASGTNYSDNNVMGVLFHSNLGFLGRASMFELSTFFDGFGANFSAEEGPLFRGYWYFAPGFAPVTSNLTRIYHEPGSFVEAIEDVSGTPTSKIFRRLNATDSMTSIAWRVN